MATPPRTDTPWQRLGYRLSMTREERRLLGSVLALALLGLTVRFWHVHRLKPEPYTPAGTGTGDGANPSSSEKWTLD